MSGFASLDGWGEPIASWDYSGNVTQVDFTNLGGYRELLIWGDGLTTDTAGTDGPALRLSTDNGSTFLATSYSNGGSASSTSVVVNAAGASSVSHGFVLTIIDFNSSSRKPKISGSAFVIGGAGTNIRWATRAAAAHNAIRIFPISGANFTAGLIRVFGRN